jgi:hypothetical protein
VARNADNVKRLETGVTALNDFVGINHEGKKKNPSARIT